MKLQYRLENEKRFWRNVPVNQGETGCWIWVGATQTVLKPNGPRKTPWTYFRQPDGRLKLEYARRIAWKMYFGWESLMPGDWIMRNPAKCEDELCVSPHHHMVTDKNSFQQDRAGALAAMERRRMSEALLRQEEEFNTRQAARRPKKPANEEEFLSGK